LYVLKGLKIVHLAPPNALKCLSVFSINNNQAHNVEKKRRLKVCIKKGECLFIPRGWFHRVRSIGKPIIAVNFWGNSLKLIKPLEYDLMLRYLIN
jgi:hypothetical protein